MAALTRVFGIYVAYLLSAKASLSLKHEKLRFWLFALINLAAVTAVFYSHAWRPLLLYVAVVLFQYGLMTLLPASFGPSFFFPIIVMVTAKAGPLHGLPIITFVGISYMAFRLSYLSIEVRNNIVPKPALPEFLSFAFFLPTIMIGPISPYQAFRETSYSAPWARALLRILAGAAKFFIFSPFFEHFSYGSLLASSGIHTKAEFVRAAVSYYLYLYCNFDGFCDVAIGTSALLGIHVLENFKNPLVSRNFKEFWNRWHITLSTFTRDTVFYPLTQWLVSRFGNENTDHFVAVSILATFLIIGLWHGIALHFLVFGAFHAMGVAGNHYYTIFLKKKLGLAKLKEYRENAPIHVLAVALTFIFVTVSFFFFANDFSAAQILLRSIQ